MSVLDKVRVLLTSAGERVDWLRACRKAGEELNIPIDLFACDPSPAISPACLLADFAFELPETHCQDYLPKVIHLCELQDIDLLLPGNDRDLLKLASGRARFEEIGTTVAAGNLSIVALSRDIENLSVIADSIGIARLRLGSLRKVAQSPDDWTWPLTVVPRKQQDRHLGKMVLRSPAELVRIPPHVPVLLMEACEGRHIHAQVHVGSEGKIVFCGLFEVLLHEGGRGAHCITVRDQKITDLAHAVVDILNPAPGPLTIEFIDGADGQTYLQGFTPMLSTYYQLVDTAGGKLLKWMIGNVAGLREPVNLEWTEGLQMLRYPAAMYVAR